MMSSYSVPNNPKYNANNIRMLQDSDPASATNTFNPLFQRLINNTHAVKGIADTLKTQVSILTGYEISDTVDTFGDLPSSESIVTGTFFVVRADETQEGKTTVYELNSDGVWVFVTTLESSINNIITDHDLDPNAHSSLVASLYEHIKDEQEKIEGHIENKEIHISEKEKKALVEIVEGGGVGVDNIQNGAISTVKLADNSVTATKLASNSVTTAKIADSNVTTAKINASAVTTDKINNSAVTADKLASNAVTTAKIADLNVTTAKINTGAVTTDKLADNSVTTPKIANGTITGTKLTNATVTQTQLANNSVGTNQLINSGVTTDKINNLAITADKLGSSAVTTAKISNLAVTADKLGSSSVTTAKINTSAVTSAKIADLNVTTAKIGNLAVTGAKIADGTITPDKLATTVNLGGIKSVQRGSTVISSPTFSGAGSATGSVTISEVELSKSYVIVSGVHHVYNAQSTLTTAGIGAELLSNSINFSIPSLFSDFGTPGTNRNYIKWQVIEFN